MSGKLLGKNIFFFKEKFEQNRFKKRMNEIIINDMFIPMSMSYNNFGKKTSQSTFHSRCRFSGRAKANFNKFRLSRMIFKKYSEFGLINGIKKASW